MPHIAQVAFESRVKPQLSFEIMRFSKLVTRMPPQTLQAPSRFNFYIVYYGMSRTSRHAVDFEQFTIEPHDVVFVAPGRVQIYEPSRGLEMWMMLFTPDFLALSADSRGVDPLRGAQVLSPLWSKPRLAVPPEGRRELLELILQLGAEYARPLDIQQPALLSSLLRALLLKCERLASAGSGDAVTSPPILSRFCALVEAEHARNRAAGQYASALGLTPRALNVLIHQRFGQTAKEYIDDRVVLEMKRELAHADLSVKELASRFHFSDPTNLVKFFRQRARMTPLGFRDSARQLSSQR